MLGGRSTLANRWTIGSIEREAEQLAPRNDDRMNG